MSKQPNSEPTPAGSGDLSPWNLLGQIVSKINVQVFLFAIAIVIVVAIVGDRIPTVFQALIYTVVLLAMGIYVFQVAMPVWIKYQEKKRAAATPPPPENKTPAPSEPSSTATARDHSAAAAGGSAAATGGGTAISGQGQ